jgi:hypothetical protein
VHLPENNGTVVAYKPFHSDVNGITGHREPAVPSRAFAHDSRAALASLTALDASTPAC